MSSGISVVFARQPGLDRLLVDECPPLGPMTLESPIDTLQEIFSSQVLGKEIVGASPHGFDYHGGIGLAAANQDRGELVQLLEIGQQVESAAVGKVEVEENDLGTPLHEVLPCPLTVGHRLDRMRGTDEKRFEIRLAQLGLATTRMRPGLLSLCARGVIVLPLPDRPATSSPRQLFSVVRNRNTGGG